MKEQTIKNIVKCALRTRLAIGNENENWKEFAEVRGYNQAKAELLDILSKDEVPIKQKP
jgi:hypothetical protein